MCCSVLQCVAVCCSVLQCVAVPKIGLYLAPSESIVEAEDRHGPNTASKSERAVTYFQIFTYYSQLLFKRMFPFYRASAINIDDSMSS